MELASQADRLQGEVHGIKASRDQQVGSPPVLAWAAAKTRPLGILAGAPTALRGGWPSQVRGLVYKLKTLEQACGTPPKASHRQYS